MVLSFPCRILCVLALLSATETPEELSVIHSIAAEPPNSGTENKGALAKQNKNKMVGPICKDKNYFIVFSYTHAFH